AGHARARKLRGHQRHRGPARAPASPSASVQRRRRIGRPAPARANGQWPGSAPARDCHRLARVRCRSAWPLAHRGQSLPAGTVRTERTCRPGRTVWLRCAGHRAGRWHARDARQDARASLHGPDRPDPGVYAAGRHFPAGVPVAPVRAHRQEPAHARRPGPVVLGRSTVSYLLLKWLHVLSATILFGTGIGSAYYLLCASLSREPRLIGRVAAWVVRADWMFTASTIVLQPLTGWLLMRATGFTLDAYWIRWSIGLYVLAFACWVPV